MSDVFSVRDEVYRRLDEWGIVYRKISHAPAATLEECEAVSRALGAMVCKNYFLTTRSRKHFCLLVARPNARLRTADISRQAGTPRLTFAGEDDMMEFLRTRPGSVSPLGLMFDGSGTVRLLVDRGLCGLEEMAFHPCDNTETLVVSARDFLEVLPEKLGRKPEFVEFHDFMDDDCSDDKM